MKLRTNKQIKGKLSSTLRNWLPYLEADIESLKETLDKATKDNPFVEIKSGNELSQDSGDAYNQKLAQDKNKQRIKDMNDINISNSSTDTIEAMATSEKTLYEVLAEQIENSPNFPTSKSKNIAYAIVDNLNENGYFDANMEELSKEIGEDSGLIERIRLRFQYLEPSGIGSLDLWESFMFQLNDYDLEEDVYLCCKKLINDFDNLDKYHQKEPHFLQAVKIIKNMNKPPAIEYQQELPQITPDLFISNNDGKIKVDLNDDYYPTIEIDLGGIENKFDFVKQKVKEANSLIDALDLRKSTLKKMGYMLLEYQYEFFNGGPIRPMKLDDLAEELGRHHSTISRAVSNKYISCDRGIFPLKHFFTTALGEDGDISNSQIKDYIVNIIDQENREKPLSDNKILTLIEKEFGLKLGRRTVTKYRNQAGIVSSSDRKKIYQFT